MPRQNKTLSLQTPQSGSTLTIPHLFSPRSYQARPMAYIDAGGKRAVTVWHRRAGKDLCWLNQVIKQMVSLPFCATYLYIFPKLTQGRRDLWDAKSSPASGGIPFRSHFPPALVMESSETEMQITLKPMPHQQAQEMATGHGKTKKVGSVFQVMGTDKDSIENLRGINAYGTVFSEYQDQNPEGWEKIIQPVLMENGGWAAFDYTPKGKNHGFTLYEQARQNPAWFCERLTIADTRRDATGEDGGPVVTPAQIDQLRAEGTDEQIIQQEYYCFPPDTMITTSRGQVPIQDVRVGDVVLTHAARWRPVRALLHRHYTGPITTIQTYGHATPLRCTPNHPIRLLDPATQRYRWQEAGTVRKGQYAVLPRIKPGIPLVTAEVATILAWYVTEGSVSQTAVQFSLSHTEQAEADRLQWCLKLLGCDTSMRIVGTALQLQAKSARLADLCVRACGSGSAHKRLPWDLIAGHEALVFRELMAGDGCQAQTDKEEWWSYTTTSLTLAHDVQMLAGALGYRAGISKRHAQQGTIRGRTINGKPSYSVQIRHQGAPTKIRPAKHGIGVQIRSIYDTPYDGPVYNLSVAIDESYVADGRVVHNCSFDGFLRGTIYGDMLKQARADGRICRVPWISTLPVGTMWDIGRRDATSIWFYQCVGSEIRFIDYYSNGGGPGVEHYVKVCREKPYLYGKVMLPHDAKHKGFSAVQSTEQILEQALCRNVVVTKKGDSIETGIRMVRSLFSRFVFDEEHCGRTPNPNHPSGLDCLANYRRDWNEEYHDYSGQPLHDAYSHGADGIRTGAEAWEEGLFFTDQVPVEMKVESIFDANRAFMGRQFAGRA